MNAPFAHRDAAERAEVEAEQRVLAGLLVNPKAFDALPEGFGPGRFVVEGHDAIFDAALRAHLDEPGARHITPAVERALPHLAPPGEPYIRTLVANHVSARPADIALWAKGLMDASSRRGLAALARDVEDALRGGDEGPVPTPEVIARLAEGLDAVAAQARLGRPQATLDRAMDEAIETGRRAAETGGMSGMPIGFASLDARLGGLEGGCVYILAARPGVGKTALALQIALRAARRVQRAAAGGGVGFVSLEMSARQVGRRALSLASGIDLMALKRGDYEGDASLASRLVRGRAEYAGMPLLIEDEGHLSAATVRARARAMARRLGGLKLLVVDHFHFMGLPEGTRDERQGLTANSKGIKALAKDMDIPVLLLCQLNRGVEGRDEKRPGLADLRGTGSLEEDADAVMFIHRPDYHARHAPERRLNEREGDFAERLAAWEQFVRENEGRAEILFEKVRDGEPGMELLRFAAARFSEEGEDRP